MKVTELPPVNVADLAHISEEQLIGARSVGLHVTETINYIMVTSGLKELNDFTEDDLELFAIIGRLWEQMLANVMFKPPRYQRPGEIECDGIFGSPDAVDTEEASLMEFKVTWKSSSRAIESFFKYMLQIKAYCWMLGLTRCYLYVFFVCGNWKPPSPQIRAWRFDFTHHELRDNWAILMANGREITGK